MHPVRMCTHARKNHKKHQIDKRTYEIDCREMAPRMGHFMSYWYAETADSSTRDQREFLVKADFPDEVCQTVLRECGAEYRLIFLHHLSPFAQEIVEDEYEAECASERVADVIIGIRNVFVQEGYDIMKKKNAPSFEVHQSGIPALVPDILSVAEEAKDGALIPCTFEDIRTLINFCLKKGMQEYLQKIAARVAVAN